MAADDDDNSDRFDDSDRSAPARPLDCARNCSDDFDDLSAPADDDDRWRDIDGLRAILGSADDRDDGSAAAAVLLDNKGAQTDIASAAVPFCERYGYRCNSPACRRCANYKSQRRTAHIRRLTDAPAWAADDPTRRRFYHVTLTTTPSSTYGRAVENLLASFKRLRRLQSWGLSFVGGHYSVEASAPDDAGAYRVHLHVVAEGFGFVDADSLAHEWRRLTTADSVSIAPAFDVDGLSDYATKPAAHDLFDDPDALREWTRQTKGLRLVGCFGTWRGQQQQPQPMTTAAPAIPQPMTTTATTIVPAHATAPAVGPAAAAVDSAPVMLQTPPAAPRRAAAVPTTVEPSATPQQPQTAAGATARSMTTTTAAATTPQTTTSPAALAADDLAAWLLSTPPRPPSAPRPLSRGPAALPNLDRDSRDVADDLAAWLSRTLALATADG